MKLSTVQQCVGLVVAIVIILLWMAILATLTNEKSGHPMDGR